MRQEQINHEKALLPERCEDWERHEHALRLDPLKWISETKYRSPECADNKACCIHWLKLIMGELADNGMGILLFWIQCREVAGEYETEVIMQIMTDILTKKEKHKVMMTIVDKYYDTKEAWESYVRGGKPYRMQIDYLRMKECKERLSKAFGLTDDALKMYEVARKKRIKRLVVKERRDTIKEDKGFSMPQVCSDIGSHRADEVEKMFEKRGSLIISLFMFDRHTFTSSFGEKICCRYKLGLILKELLRNEGLVDYINHIISTKRLLKYQPKQLRIYLGTEMKILHECDRNKVMECLGDLYTETGLKLQKNEREVNCPVPENVYLYISYLENQKELHERKERLSILTRLIRKLS
ncbi:hypothetical protein [Candidatus Brocadia sapporoensis]|nr:hypothetical protein [Candidatus Brocadia sapporoensis]